MCFFCLSRGRFGEGFVGAQTRGGGGGAGSGRQPAAPRRAARAPFRPRPQAPARGVPGPAHRPAAGRRGRGQGLPWMGRGGGAQGTSCGSKCSGLRVDLVYFLDFRFSLRLRLAGLVPPAKGRVSQEPCHCRILDFSRQFYELQSCPSPKALPTAAEEGGPATFEEPPVLEGDFGPPVTQYYTYGNGELYYDPGGHETIAQSLGCGWACDSHLRCV